MRKEYKALLRSQLFPCPFCGCADVDIRTRKVTLVECTNCRALIIRLAEKDAVKDWNRRPQMAKGQTMLHHLDGNLRNDTPENIVVMRTTDNIEGKQ